MEDQFDRNRATIGVHNRSGFNPGHKPANIGHQGVSISSEDIGGGFGVGMFADAGFEEDRAEALKVGSSDGSVQSRFTPENVEWPLFPEVGGQNPDNVGRRSASNTDLETHGLHEYPKPSAKQLIQERLRNMRKQMFHNQKEEVQDQQEVQDANHEAAKVSPVDISIDRSAVDINRSGYLTKGASSMSLLEEREANPIKIMLVLDQAWEEDWREWEPETILQTLESGGVEIAKINLDKIMALKVLLNTLEFWKDPRTFEKVCLAFAGRMVDWGHIQEPRVHEIAACVALIDRYVAEHEFHDDVAAYVAGSAVRDGYVLLPPVLSFAEFPFSSELAFAMGDEVLEVQMALMNALEDESDIPKDHGVQYMRLLRCQYHIQDMIDQAKM